MIKPLCIKLKTLFRMNIIFSNSIFFLQKKGGISRYFVNLSKQLNLLKVKNKIIAPLSKNLYLKEFNDKKISFYFNKIPNNFFLNILNNFLFKFYSNREKVDIIHETYYNEKNFESFKHKLKILTVYDLIHEKFSHNYEKKKNFRKKKDI